ncbi:MAG: 23S rRNA (adenine(2503)-C(2))-methyltransferase RlmN [Armatimonadota bacterium]|nr:23S rRNA (adenine(2503)-C(2))-methyltransferase RlmN [Armatimonadota bacterium]MDR5696656.1 23S rRNA (adenine(2503)-C(2))-methyltransferase RlmN [Armatimonadota bacterium]
MRPSQAPDLRSMTVDELEAFALTLGEPAYRGRQLARWVHRHGAQTFEEMTDLPARLRAALPAVARITALRIGRRLTSTEGSTTKYLLVAADGSTIESVLMRYADGRRTACVSTQVGCAMACTFCATGQVGLARNLTAGEIVDQVHRMQQDANETINRVVFMGMGEPLANYDATVRAVRLLGAPYGAGIGMRHITISTVGLVPQIRRLATERLPVTLAVSLHAPDDRLRSALVPINAQYPIAELLEACWDYAGTTRRRVTFEYVLMRGVNDTPEMARRLGALLRGALAHVNLIPWNPVPGMPYERPCPQDVRGFARALRRCGVPATVRIERGTDIMAACGQLRNAFTPGRMPRRIADPGSPPIQRPASRWVPTPASVP